MPSAINTPEPLFFYHASAIAKASGKDEAAREYSGRLILPGHAEQFRAHPMDVYHVRRPQIANPGLERDASIRLDDEQPVEADRPADVTAQRHADAAHLRTDPLWRSRHPLAPLELLCTAVESFSEECTGCMLPLPFDCRSELRLALRAVDVADGHLVKAELARGLGNYRFDDCQGR